MGVTLIGDSHAEGLAPHVPRDWTVIHRRGWSTRRLLDSGLFAPLDGVVIVSSGTNDPVGTPESVYRDAATQIGPGAIWTVPGPYNFAARRAEEQRRAALPKIRAVANVIDPHLPPTQLRRDGLHYDREGYSQWARVLIARVSPDSTPTSPGKIGAFLIIAAALSAVLLWRSA